MANKVQTQGRKHPAEQSTSDEDGMTTANACVDERPALAEPQSGKGPATGGSGHGNLQQIAVAAAYARKASHMAAGSKAPQRAEDKLALKSGAHSIESERSVPPIPVVCQCKSLDDQGCWPILQTCTAVVARLEKEADAESRFATGALYSACDARIKKAVLGAGFGDKGPRMRPSSFASAKLHPGL